MVKDTVHQVVTAKGTRRIGDVGRNARLSHGLHHGPDRQRCVVSHRAIGNRHLPLKGASGVVLQTIPGRIIQILGNTFDSDSGAPSILTYHYDAFRFDVGNAVDYKIDAFKEVIRDYARDYFSACDNMAIKVTGD
jgi:hypothetical protein